MNASTALDARPFSGGRPLPLVAEIGPADAAQARRWAEDNRAAIDDALNRAGAVLVRGAAIETPGDFRAFAAAVCPNLRPYAGGDSPRTEVGDQVYTSTEYAAELEVYLHNELSYAGWSPARVFFCCLVTAETGGQTQIADGTEIYRRLDPEVRARFETSGVTYLQHLWDANDAPGIGKSWQETFETDERERAEAYLTDARMDFEWTAIGLRTRATHPAAVPHPVTGELCWHNQADQWHRDMEGVKVSFGTRDSRIDPKTAGEATLGNHVTHGDGSEIAVSDLMQVRETAQACEVLFAWQPGDVLALDNVRTMHGRKPYTGARRVLVAMA